MLNGDVIVALRTPSTVERTGDGVRVDWLRGTVTLGAVTEGIDAALRRLVTGAPNAELADVVSAADGENSLAPWFYCLTRIERLGAITYEVREQDRPIARLEVMAPYFSPGGMTVVPCRRYALSRFASCRRDSNRIVVESPLSCAKVILIEPAAAGIIGGLVTPQTLERLQESMSSCAAATVDGLLRLLNYAGLLTAADDTADEESGAQLATWHHADLSFHGRSRVGRHDDPNSRYAFRDRIDPLPAVKPPMSADVIELFRPDLHELATADPPLTQVLEGRRSIRSYGDEPITLTQLGELLFRTARVKNVIEADGKALFYQASRRPYPGAGGCYELELYVAAARCEGLEPGVYHYAPLSHCLERIQGGTKFLPQLMSDTMMSEESDGPRHILIIMAARFQRVFWKYNGSAYAAILKDVGVLYQTLYLVATAMRLAPCALGGGNSELFCRMIGTAFHEETSVGEFMIGSRPHETA